MFLKVFVALAIFFATTARAYLAPTPVSSRNVPSLVGHYEERRGRPFCLDMCAQSLDGEARGVKSYFTSHCSSFLSTTIAPTVVT